MKKLLKVLLVLTTALYLTGCSPQQQNFSSITVYYPYQSNVQNKSLTIGYETRTIDGNDTLKAAIDAVSGSPSNSYLKAIFPDGVKILSYTVNDGGINLVMSDTYAELALGDKAVARSCLALTLCGISGINNLSIFVGDIPDTKNIKAQDIMTENTKLNPFEAKVKLYFSNGKALAPEYRDITLGKDHPSAFYIMEELLKGPHESSLNSAIPAGTTLLSLTVSNRICTVNLSPEFLNNKNGTEAAGTLAVYSIVNTLTAISGVGKVQILVNGEKVNSYLNVSIYYPLTEKNDIISQ